MATARSDNRRSGQSGSTRRRSTRSTRRTGDPARKPLQGRDTGYRVGSNHRQSSMRNVNPRIIIAGIIALLLIIAMIFGISSCVKGCSAKSEKKQAVETEQKVNPDDKRVAYGVSSEVTAKLGEVLDRNETFAKIAKYADKITDERLIDLAIAEPDAIDFVAGSIKADGSTQPYGTAVPEGEFPQLYTFDERWGYMTYADGILGVTGSGPVAVSMASIGLSGNTNYDPVTVAEAITASKLANGSSGMDDSFLVNHASDAGLQAIVIEASSDGIYGAIAEYQPVLIKLKADSGIGSAYAHWALITQLNTDNSISVYDPTSVAASSHTWSLGAIAARCDTAYSVSATSGSSNGTDDNSATQDEYPTSEESYESESVEEG